ncbi:MAG: tetratricopeptide repeat protein [Desulfotomaculaceae bacterium]
MRTVGLFLIISLLLRNPLLALLIIILIYIFLDRRFIGILPDFMAPLRRRRNMAELKRQVQVNPHNANAQLELGEIYFLNGQYKQAVEYLEKALVKMDDSALARFYMGAALFNLGQRDESLQQLKEAISLNPKIAHGYPYLYLVKHEYSEELVANLLRYGAVKTFYDAGKYFKQVGNRHQANQFFDEVLDAYRLSSPTMRRQFRNMAIYARLFGKTK